MTRPVDYEYDQPTKVREEPAPEDRLQEIMEDLNVGAESLEAEARDYEDRMLLCRARAAGLRAAAGGMKAAIERFMVEIGKRQEFIAHRDGEDRPASPDWDGKISRG